MHEVCQHLPRIAEANQGKNLAFASLDNSAKRSEEHLDSHVKKSDLVSFSKKLMRMVQDLKGSEEGLDHSLKVLTSTGPKNCTREVANRVLTNSEAARCVRVHTLCPTLVVFQGIVLIKAFDQTIDSTRNSWSDRVRANTTTTI